MARHTALFLAVLAVELGPRICEAQSLSNSGPVTRSRAEIESLIEKVGKTPPDWWDSTPLTYPPTLDLNWPMRAEGPWDARKNVGQYLWDVINPNPGRWKEGIKLVNHLMIRHRDDPQKLVRAMETLGRMYHDLMEDWARAVFWWRLCERHGGNVDPVGLAHCYWKLGSKEMAAEVLAKIGPDDTRHGAVIKLWADMGEFDKALALVTQRAADGMPTSAYLTAGDTCRLAGRYNEALAWYQKALTVKEDLGREADVKKDKERAQASIQAIKLFDVLEVAEVADGVYAANSLAYAGPLYVEVAVQGGRIEAVRVTKHEEKQFYSALTDTPNQIVRKQSVKGVDAVTGATMTAEAIINATAKALAGGMRKKAK
ncbi:MAG: FMN-binding protein [Planctomycetes bacterium]|nr:FMN-binding protein [Planctomycetota bacterium]